MANQGKKYDYIAATRGKNYAFFYTYTGRNIKVKIRFLSDKLLKYYWFNPKDGSYTQKHSIQNVELKLFDASGEEKAGNDWVLILES